MRVKMNSHGTDEQKIENAILEIVDSILDIESILHENYKFGLNENHQKILKKCKNIIHKNASYCNLFNIEFSQGEGGFNADRVLVELPRVLLNFKEREFDYSIGDLDFINIENTRVSSVVNRINILLKKAKLKDISSVLKKYSSDKDGFMFEIPVTKNLTLDELKARLDIVKSEVENLSLNKIMVTQQFSNAFKLSFSKPYHELKSSADGILISILNMNFESVLYFLKNIFELINFKIRKCYNDSQVSGKTIATCNEKFETLNGSYVEIKINIRVI